MIGLIQDIDTPAGPVRLRPETETDAGFRYELFCRSRLPEWDMVVLEPHLRDQLMRHQFHAQTVGYRAQFPAARFDIVERQGRPIGRIVVDRPGDQLHLVDMAITPEMRRLGIGSAILDDLKAEAARSAVPVMLEVASTNDPSMALYLRHGFEVTETAAMYIEMVWNWPAPGG